MDEVTSPHIWVSVVVFGRYHELPDTPLPDAVATGDESFVVLGAMAGG